jgi:hypothetical protein
MMKKLVKNQGRLDQLQLSAAILACLRHLGASNKALNLLYRAMRAVLYRHTAVAMKMASLVGTFVCRCFVCCCPGGRWGNMEQVVAQWQRPVAFRVALDMPHWAMHLYCSGTPLWPSKWPADEVHLFVIVALFVS